MSNGGDKLAKFTGTVAQWQEAMRKASGVLDSIAYELAIEMVNLTRERFRTGTDPYGRAWRNKKIPDGRGALHGPTGRLKGGWFIASARPDMIMVRPSVNYAIYHQSDAPRKRLPRRMMVPDGSKGMPPDYAARLDSLVNEVLSIHFGGSHVGAARSRLGIRVRL